MNEQLIAEECVDTWGIKPQLNQAMEELAECIVAINKFRRSGFNDVVNLAEEIADVEITLECIKCIGSRACPKFRDMVENWKNYKLKGLEDRLVKS